MARELGCFGCHGPGGASGFEDVDGNVGSVPPFTPDAVRGHAKNEAELREWILDGLPRRLREAEGPSAEPAPLLRMPAFRGRLGDGELDDLVAYLKALSDFEMPPEGSPAANGHAAALRLGCFQCHGPQGRGDTPNPGSLKGYIPSWSGSDFGELVRDDAELREWVLAGAPRWLREHPVASFFLERQLLRMPAYEGRLAASEIEALVAYIAWLRAAPAR